MKRAQRIQVMLTNFLINNPLHFVFCMVCLITILNLENQAIFAKETSKQSLQTVIFEVESSFHQSDQSRSYLGISPIVVIEGGQYMEPPVTCNESEEFGMSWFRLGTEYRVLHGGGEAGHVTVTKWLVPEPDGCDQNAAMIDMKLTRKLDQGESFLATNSKGLGGTRSLRRLPTPEEEAKILELGREAFRAKGVREKQIRSMKTSHLAVIDVDDDGINEMLGSFSIEIQMKKETIRHDVFLLLEKQMGIYLPAIFWFHSGSGVETHLKTFIDNVDLDQDGIQELIVEQMFVCGITRYQIYSKREGEWQSIYEGGGSKC